MKVHPGIRFRRLAGAAAGRRQAADPDRHCAGRGTRRSAGATARAVTLIELLCVMAIIGILMSMIAPVAFKALKKARQLSGEIEGPAFQEEIQRKYTPYRLSNPGHPVLDRDGFIRACGLSSKAAAWLKSREVRFTPFSGSTPATTAVIEQRMAVIPNRPQVTVYTVMDLLLPEPQ
ncbi:MAG: type II secretion system protein [Verrucomicrobiota bacterium]